MENIKIQVQYDCPVCNGMGMVVDPEYDETEPFPMHSPSMTCEKCNGKTVITEFVSLHSLLEKIAKMDIQI